MAHSIKSPSRSPSTQPRRHDAQVERTLLLFAGDLILALGAVLGVAGLLFATLYYLLAGTGFVVSGYLIAKRRRVGAWVYLAVVGLTLAFALQGATHGGTPIVMRLAGPLVLLAMIALLMPALRGWQVRRTMIAFTALATATIVVTTVAI